MENVSRSFIVCKWIFALTGKFRNQRLPFLFDLCIYLVFSFNTGGNKALFTLCHDSHLAGLQDFDLLIINSVSVLHQEAFTLILHLQKERNQFHSIRSKEDQASRFLQLFATSNS